MTVTSDWNGIEHSWSQDLSSVSQTGQWCLTHWQLYYGVDTDVKVANYWPLKRQRRYSEKCKTKIWRDKTRLYEAIILLPLSVYGKVNSYINESKTLRVLLRKQRSLLGVSWKEW